MARILLRTWSADAFARRQQRAGPDVKAVSQEACGGAVGTR